MGDLDMIDMPLVDPGGDNDAAFALTLVIRAGNVQKRAGKSCPLETRRDVGQGQAATLRFGLLGASSEFSHRSSVSWKCRSFDS